MTEINIVQQQSGEAKLQLVNGIDFEYRNLTMGIPAQSFQNSLNQVFNYIGSCEVENKTIGLGTHYIIEGKNDRHYLIKVESFEANFKPVTEVIVLGWGSLIWDPRELEVRGKWMYDGPFLPVEFARVSSHDRLTLVRKPDAKPVQVLWNVMNLNFQDSIENLNKREGCVESNCVGFIDMDNLTIDEDKRYFIEPIIAWCRDKGFEKVIWTDLGVKFKNKTGFVFSENSAIEYLKGLKDPSNAKEYIQRAPGQIQTSLRQKIAIELGW